MYTAGPDGFAVDWAIGKSHQSHGTEVMGDTLVFLYEPFIFGNSTRTNVLDWSLKHIAKRNIGLKRCEDISLNEHIDLMHARHYPTSGLQKLKKELTRDIPHFDASSKIYDMGNLILTGEQIARNRLLYRETVGADSLSKVSIPTYKIQVSRAIAWAIEFAERAGTAYSAYSELLAASKRSKK